MVGIGATTAARSVVPLALALLVGLTACGGSTSATNAASPPPTAAAATSPSAGTSNGAERFGSPITISTADGYRFALRASPPHGEPTVEFPMGAESTPPGKTHVVIDVQVQNPLSDRQEPIGGELADTTDDETRFDLAIPMVDRTSFGLSACGDRSPANWCLFGDWLAVPSGFASATTEVDPGATVLLQISELGGVPETAPLNHVTLYIWDGSSEVQVPPAS